jgi:hypothetical protein
MKNIIISMFTLFTTCAFAQVAIGKASVTSPSVSLEFGTGNKGILLPWVTGVSTVTGAVNGTLVYNTTDKKVYVKYASGWKDLSVDATGTTVDPITNVDGLTLQNSLNDLNTAKVSIGTPTSTPGILVLEDTNKAMVLPKVASPHLTIINPAPGMMAYDTTSKQLAVFNGTVWSFWKP